MGKWICEACNTPCTFDSGNYGGAVNPSGGCGKENWREVKEEPEKTPAGVVTWTNVPPSGCVLIPHMAFECPECKEKDERIDGLRESHRDFVDMHNATKRDKDAEIGRLNRLLSAKILDASEEFRQTRASMENELEELEETVTRLSGEVDDRDEEIEALKIRLDESGEDVETWKKVASGRADKIRLLKAQHEEVSTLLNVERGKVFYATIDQAGPVRASLDSILELLQGSLAGKEEAAAARSKITKQNKDAARINEVQNARVDGQLDRLDELLHGLEPGTPPEMTGPESNDAGKITGKD